MNVTEQLDRLAEMKSQADVIQAHYDELRAAILTPEIRAQLASIDAEQEQTMEAVSAGIVTLENEIKAAVVTGGASVKGAYLMAVYSKPRVTWDTKGLDGFRVAHPEIDAFRKEGSPSVSIRAVK